MPFDPSFPPHGVGLVSADWRAQFNSLKALIDALTATVTAQQTQINGLLPIGIIVAWPKDITGMPGLPGTWVQCNGQTLSDADSPLNGRSLPDLNNGSFLRGALASGGTGGSDSHTHDVEVGPSFSGVNVDSGGSGFALDGNPKTTSAGSTLPPYYEVVFVMRIK